MKIYVDGKLYDGKAEPIAVILDNADKRFIANMKPTEHVYINFTADEKDLKSESVKIYHLILNALRNNPSKN